MAPPHYFEGSTTDGRRWKATWRVSAPITLAPTETAWDLTLDGLLIDRLELRRGAAASEKEVRRAVRALLRRRSLELADI
jgi:hypothetical protein